MNVKIKMTEIETGKSGFVFRNVIDVENAGRIVARLNEINRETAKLTGKAIRFMFTLVNGF
jgi:hypothetical protein